MKKNILYTTCLLLLWVACKQQPTQLTLFEEKERPFSKEKEANEKEPFSDFLPISREEAVRYYLENYLDSIIAPTMPQMAGETYIEDHYGFTFKKTFVLKHDLTHEADTIGFDPIFYGRKSPPPEAGEHMMFRGLYVNIGWLQYINPYNKHLIIGISIQTKEGFFADAYITLSKPKVLGRVEARVIIPVDDNMHWYRWLRGPIVSPYRNFSDAPPLKRMVEFDMEGDFLIGYIFDEEGKVSHLIRDEKAEQKWREKNLPTPPVR